MTILLPSGQRVVLDHIVDYSASSNVVTFVLPGGVGPLAETLPSDANATGLLAQIDNLKKSGVDGVYPVNGSPAIITGVVPSSFITGGAGPNLNIYGTGFNLATLGKVYLLSLTDALAGTLSAYYRYTVSMISPNHLIAVYDTSSSPPSAPMVLVYVDSNGAVSPPVAVIAAGSGAGLAWSTITPNSVSYGNVYSFVIAGTGFLSAGITNIAFPIPGNQYAEVTFSVVSDIEIDTGGAYSSSFQNGPNTIYYSTDNGVTFQSTGLTVTLS